MADSFSELQSSIKDKTLENHIFEENEISNPYANGNAFDGNRKHINARSRVPDEIDPQTEMDPSFIENSSKLSSAKVNLPLRTSKRTNSSKSKRFEKENSTVPCFNK